MKGKIFNAQEVQAILNGSKVMFREVIKPRQPRENRAAKLRVNKAGNFVCMEWKDEPDLRIKGFGTDICKCPYQVGQKIFCKESFWEAGGKIIYKADYESYKPISPWRRAMKQEHSRLTLLIKEIRVERLADISEEDAIAEGFKNTFVGFQHPVYNPGRTANQDFEIFWNATHKKPEEKFEANPWVWSILFEVENAN